MARVRSNNDSDNDDDDRPRRRRRRDDDDDDDDDYPKRKQGGSGSGMLIGIIVVVGVFLLGGIGLCGFLFFRAERKKPEPEVADKQTPDGMAPQDGAAPTVKPKTGGNPTVGTDPGKLSTGAVRIPPFTPTVTQVVLSGGEDGFAAIVSNKKLGVGYIIDIIKTATGKVTGQIQTDTVTDSGYAINPDGNTLAVLRSNPSEGNSVLLFTVDNGLLLKQFTPYPKEPGSITVPELVWIAFIGKDQLLTINSGGGFDLWSVPGMMRTTGKAATLKGGNRISVNGFTHSPNNFSLSTDGNTLAIFNGSGFSFYDAKTATEIVHTENLMQPGNSILFSAAAISPDGKRFASFYQTFGAGAATSLSVWDSKTGKLLTGGPVGKIKSPAGFAWWGSSHLLFWEGGIATASLFSVESGQLTGSVRTSIPGKFATVPPNGQLWGVVGGNGYDPVKGAAFLVHVDVPSAVRPNTTLELSQEGLKTK